MLQHARRSHPARPGSAGSRILLIGLVSMLLAVALAAPWGRALAGNRDPDAPGESAGRSSRNESTGPVPLFRAHCVKCHDEDGRGESSRDLMRRIPDFTDPKWHLARSDHDLARSVLEGKGQMPSMKAKLGNLEVSKVVRLVRNFRGGEFEIPDDVMASERLENGEADPRPSPTSPPPHAISRSSQRDDEASIATAALAMDQARILYQRYCVSCHGEDGRSGPLRPEVRSAPDFTSAAWHEGRGIQRVRISILEGRGNRMPSFQGRLSEAEAGRLAEFVRSFSGAPSPSAVEARDEFDRQFRDLMRELDELKQRYHATNGLDPRAGRNSRD